MLVTIWMCTQEWSLISMRTAAFTFATCHQPFSCLSAFTRSSSVRSFRFPRVGNADPHLLDRLGGCEARLLLGLLRNRLLDPFFGLPVERHPRGLYSASRGLQPGRLGSVGSVVRELAIEAGGLRKRYGDVEAPCAASTCTSETGSVSACSARTARARRLPCGS